MKEKLVLFMLALFVGMLQVDAQKALVIIAHGAPGKQWNEPVLNLENDVRSLLKEKGIGDFNYVRVALMEFSEPTVASVIKDCESRGIRQIYVVPLFIAPSSHSEQDVPNILGLKYNSSTIGALKEEKTSIVHTSIQMTEGPTLSYGDVIKDIIADRVKAMSKRGKGETFVLIAHGDPDYLPMWNDLLEQTGNVVAARIGVKFSGYTYVGMGQHFYHDFLPLAKKVSKIAKRVVVQGIYLSNGLNGMTTFSLKDATQKKYAREFPKNVTFLYSDKGLLPDNRITEWIVDRASEWINSK